MFVQMDSNMVAASRNSWRTTQMVYDRRLACGQCPAHGVQIHWDAEHASRSSSRDPECNSTALLDYRWLCGVRLHDNAGHLHQVDSSSQDVWTGPEHQLLAHHLPGVCTFHHKDQH